MSVLYSGLKPGARLRKWTDTSPAEIRVLIAMHIWMGALPKAELQQYWSSDPLVETPYFRRVMTSKRFALLERCLHFTDTSTPLSPTVTGADKVLWRIKVLWRVRE